MKTLDIEKIDISNFEKEIESLSLTELKELLYKLKKDYAKKQTGNEKPTIMFKVKDSWINGWILYFTSCYILIMSEGFEEKGNFFVTTNWNNIKLL